MSAETLRRAAALMRERAEAVSYSSPWQIGGGTCGIRSGDGEYVAATYGGLGTEEAAAQHIVSWDPTVALTVADWLDDEAFMVEEAGRVMSGAALTLARAYLGE